MVDIIVELQLIQHLQGAVHTHALVIFNNHQEVDAFMFNSNRRATKEHTGFT